MNADFLRLNGKDLLRGLVVVVITALISPLTIILQSGKLPTGANLQVAGLMSLTAGIGYLVKNMLTNSQDQMFKTEKKVG